MKVSEFLILSKLQKEVYQNSINKGFYDSDEAILELLKTETNNRTLHQHCKDLFIIKRLALIHSEISEALEGLRNSEDNNLSEEFADATIRILDLAEFCNIDLGHAIYNKMKINSKRPYLHGKKF